MFEIILRIMTTSSVVVAAAAVYTTIRNNTRQLSAQIFLAYSDRLQSIRQSMRDDLLSTRADDIDPTENYQIPPGALEALHLIFELFELKEQKYIRKTIWEVWLRDIDRFLCSPKIRQGREQIAAEFFGHRKFITWVESRQDAVQRKPKARKTR